MVTTLGREGGTNEKCQNTNSSNSRVERSIHLVK